MSTELAERPSSELMPAFSIQSAVDRYNAVLDFTKTIMKPGKDYGAIPGTSKPTLLKPGAEKLCSFFGLALDYEETEKVCDWQGGFFFFSYKAILSRDGRIVATGIGSCNSKEKKYRWRNAEMKCPACGKPTILRSKDGPGFFCWRKKGGCGANFGADDQRITNQPSGQVENTEPFDLVNTIQKMAQKRALVAATLVAANASEFYTQDVEDMDVIEGEFTVHEPEEKPKPIKANPARVAELVGFCKQAKIPEATVTSWLKQAKAESFDDFKPETVEGCIRFCQAELKKQASQPDPKIAYLKFVEQCESAASETGLTPEELSRALGKSMKAMKLTGKEWESTEKDRAQILDAIKKGSGYYTPTKEKALT